jgi:rRNA maturation endonuclease Nob1
MQGAACRFDEQKMSYRYRCQKCRHCFEKSKPGPVVCNNCGHLYIDWLNFKEVLESLGNYKNEIVKETRNST